MKPILLMPSEEIVFVQEPKLGQSYFERLTVDFLLDLGQGYQQMVKKVLMRRIIEFWFDLSTTFLRAVAAILVT